MADPARPVAVHSQGVRPACVGETRRRAFGYRPAEHGHPSRPAELMTVPFRGELHPLGEAAICRRNKTADSGPRTPSLFESVIPQAPRGVKSLGRPEREISISARRDDGP